MALRSTSQRTTLLIAALSLLIAGLALCADRIYNGDVYLQLLSGRFIAHHGIVGHDPFPTVAHGQPWLNQQWLAEITAYLVTRAIGLAGLGLAYALLLATPLSFLLWICRRKGAPMLLAVSALYAGGLWSLVHPRPAAFSLLAFSLLVVLLARALALAESGRSGAGDLRWPLLGMLGLFALWANLHAGFVAGIVLLALASMGLFVERLRGSGSGLPSNHVGALALTGLASVAIATLLTPLGGAIWSYIMSFRDPAISLLSHEWSSAFQSPLAICYLAFAAAFAAWLYWRSPRPRRLTPLLVSAGFVVLGLLSLRSLIFVGPALAFQVARSAPDFPRPAPRWGVSLAAAVAVAGAAAWAVHLGPARNQPPLGSNLVNYAIAHPPSRGHIASEVGVGSYILWRSPSTPVVVDGWLEHFDSTELLGATGLVRGWYRNPMPFVRRLQVGAVISDASQAVAPLEAHGFVPVYSTSEGSYLVRRGAMHGGGRSRGVLSHG